ncbi:transposase [Streptomyces sp. NPDC001817]|uniref:transposase n=1 Tax=Streptomyces sp. NPDC001817 TaxID=3154398 RepID=UPI0033300B0E
MTDAGGVTVAIARDRNGSFEPDLVPKRARRLAAGGWRASTKRSSCCTPAASQCGRPRPPRLHVRHGSHRT